MIEYEVSYLPGGVSEEARRTVLKELLDHYAVRGWRLVHFVDDHLIFEREVTKLELGDDDDDQG